MGKKVSLPTYLSEIVQGNRADSRDKANDHLLGTPLQWAYDFAVSSGTKVNSVDNGVVYSVVGSLKGSFTGYGNEITIQSTGADGKLYYTTYAHLSSVSVAKGQSVSAGQLIGYSGSSGSLGVQHLHLQFGSNVTLTWLDKAHTTQAYIADGSRDSTAPAYFSTALTMHYDQPLNASDVVYNGTEGVDLFYANNLGDTAYGGAGNDTLRGGTGADYLDGGPGNDTLVGGAGKDTLIGGGDADILTGGAAADILTGGAGNDVFVWLASSDSAVSAPDRVTDFSRGDKLDLSAIDADTTRPGDQSFKSIGAKAFSHHAGELQITAGAKGEWFISGDVDGNGKADFTIQVHFDGNLANGDFNF